MGHSTRRRLHDHRLNMCVGRRDSTLANANPSTPSNEPPSDKHSSSVDRDPWRSEMRRPFHRHAKPRLPLLARRRALEAVSPQQSVAQTDFRQSLCHSELPRIIGPMATVGVCPDDPPRTAPLMHVTTTLPRHVRNSTPYDAYKNATMPSN